MRPIVLLLTLAACGVSVQAGPSCEASCSGCCDGEGRCQSGVEPAACGTAGRACVTCQAGQTCATGFCGALSAGGGAAGGSATAGGSSGSAETCSTATLIVLAPVPGDASKQAVSVQGTTAGARDDEGASVSSCAGAGPDRFYAVDVPAGRVLSVKVITGGAWRAVTRLRTRACSEPDDRCQTSAVGSTTASVTVGPTTAGRVIITVDGVDAASAGAFELQVETRVAPADAGVDVMAWCSGLVAAQTRFFAGRATCADGDAGVTLQPEVQQATCAARLPFCSTSDLALLDAYVTCYQSATVCAPGQEAAAAQGLQACVTPIATAAAGGQLNSTCKDALRR